MMMNLSERNDNSIIRNTMYHLLFNDMISEGKILPHKCKTEKRLSK